MQNYTIQTPVKIKGYSTEWPLLILVILFSLAIWLALISSVIGLIYVLLVGVVFFVAHAVFVAHIRGNGVRISPEQLPELYVAVRQLTEKFGLKKMPEVYLIQGDGILNAMATKFLRTKMLIIYSNLLEACDENTAARDMILAYELGHIIAGHVTLQWLLLPGMIVPFLGKALSRAREYTCDRYGLAGAGNKEDALLGLVILAAGKKYAPRVSTEVLVKQASSLNVGWMRIGEWLSTHPVLIRRIYSLDPALKPNKSELTGGILRGMIILFLAFAIIIGLSISFVFGIKKIEKQLNNAMSISNLTQ